METPASNGGGGGSGGRGGRLPRWTRQEILVLIEGKRAVEGRGRARGPGRGATTEPKWTAVSAFCRRRGVDRGPVQCRKRWSNLAGDFKKIKEWERGGKESFWGMKNDARRERRLPGLFDREVFELLEGVGTAGVAPATAEEGEGEAVFDSGRGAAEDGLFSDFEEEEEEEGEEEDEREVAAPPIVAELAAPPVVAVPISEKKYEPFQETSEPACPPDGNQPGVANNPEKGSSSRGQKRARASQEEGGDEDTSLLQQKLIQVLERNSRMLTAQLEVQNINCQLDRDQRKDQADSLLGVLGKLADALGRIADKL